MFKAVSWTSSVGTRMNAIFLALSVLSFMLVGSNLYLLAGIRGDAAAINQLAQGRERTWQMIYLSDKIANELGEHRSRRVTELRDTIDRTDRRTVLFVQGDPTVGVLPVTDNRVLSELLDREQTWHTNVRPLLLQIIDAPSADEARNLLARIEQEIPKFAKDLNDSVSAYQRISEEKAGQFATSQYGFLVVLLCSLGIAFWLLRGIIRAIAETGNSLASASSELLAGTTQQASSAQEQAAAVAETVSTVDEVQRTSEQAAGRAKSVAESAHRAAEIGKAGREAVDESVAAMGRVKEQTETIAETILALAERAQAIGEIIASVNDVAEQTNLLALNAGIEAARAGEQGAGFSVVAREIKELADQAKKATAQVRQILSEIQKATNSAVMVTEEGSKSVNATIKTIARAGETIRTLVETIDEAATAASQIMASAAQQATGMSQVQQAMHDISQATNQSTAATKQAELAAQDLNALGVKLKQLLAA